MAPVVTDDAPIETPVAPKGATMEATTASERVLAEAKPDDPKRLEKFREARAQERAGKDAPPVETKPDAASAQSAERTVSKRQQERNDYERRIAEEAERNRALQSRLDALEASLSTAPAPRTDAPPRPTTTDAPSQSDWDRYMSQPDAPKNDGKQYKTFEEFMYAATSYINGKKSAEVDARTRAEREVQDTRQYLTERASRSKQNALTDLGDLGVDLKALEANPASFTAELTKLGVADEVRNLRTFAQLRQGESGSMLNAIAEEIAECDHPIRVMQELSKPGELARVAGLKTVRAMISAIAKLDAGGSASRAPLRTQAPEPITTLTADTKGSPSISAEDRAMAEHNPRAYMKARLKARLDAQGKNH